MEKKYNTEVKPVQQEIVTIKRGINDLQQESKK